MDVYIYMIETIVVARDILISGENLLSAEWIVEIVVTIRIVRYDRWIEEQFADASSRAIIVRNERR